MNWSKKEVALTVEDYFKMLEAELKNEPYNKTEHRRILSRSLNNRDKAIEHKRRNITAALMNMGLPFIKGYKPLFNYQQLITDEIVDYLKIHKGVLEKQFEYFSQDAKTEIADKKEFHFEGMLAEPPKPVEFKAKEPKFRPIKINYLKREQANRELGEEGESLIIKYERWRLISEGKENLANKIEWISKDIGDGMGFDILSKNKDGSDRFIEVKTTKLSKETPIYLSKNEVFFASTKKNQFYLYRVFNFNEDPNFFIKNGDYKNFCSLLPETYRGYF